MKVCFRVDASLNMGSGHLSRCLSLAEHLKEMGNEVVFISRLLPGNLNTLIQKHQIPLFELPFKKTQVNTNKTAHSQWLEEDWKTDANQVIDILKTLDPIDWLIVDHYSLDAEWEIQIQPHVSNIMVIDDLADRNHVCDLLLDQNFYLNPDERYINLIPQNCHRIFGPHYALLRKEFKIQRSNLKKRDGQIRRILVFFGGTDPTQLTLRAMDVICALKRPSLVVDIVVGQSNPMAKTIQKKAMEYGFNFYEQIDKMAKLMADCDLSIGASGSTTWERCCLGLPSIVSIIADNQKSISDALKDQEVIWFCNAREADYNNLLHSQIMELFAHPEWVKKYSDRGQELVDGEGCGRVSLEMTC